MQSSRAAFSSLQTQQGYNEEALVCCEGLVSSGGLGLTLGFSVCAGWDLGSAGAGAFFSVNEILARGHYLLRLVG